VIFVSPPSGFGSQFTDLITQEVDPKTAFIVYENSQSAHNRGLELELGGKIPSGLEGRLSYTLQKTVDPSTRLSLSDSPTQLAKANIIFPCSPQPDHWIRTAISRGRRQRAPEEPEGPDAHQVRAHLRMRATQLFQF